MWAGHDFCPRVAVLGSACDNVKELVPENTSIMYVWAERTLGESEQLSRMFSGLAQVQELVVKCETYDAEVELVSPDLPEAVSGLEMLVRLELVNLRFAGRGSLAFARLSALESLRELSLRGCEVCNPSSVSPHFPSLAVLNLCLNCTETRLRLYEADFVQFCESLKDNPMLEELSLSLAFRITPLAGKVLGEGARSLSQLKKVSLIRCGLFGEAFI